MTEDLTLETEETVLEDKNEETPERKRRLWPWLLVLLALLGIFAVINAPRIQTMLEDRLSTTLPAAPEPTAPEIEPATLRLQILEQRVTALEAASNASPLLPSEAKPDKSAAASKEEQLSFGGRVSALEAEAQRLITANGALATRLDRMSEMVAQLSGTTFSSHEQMRELVLVSFVRRLIEHGRPLGAVADIADEQFRPRDPSAADALIAWSHAPVAISTLTRKLDELADGDIHPEQKWWARMQARLSQLVKVRRKDSPDPEALSKARQAMHNQELATAITQMELLPSSDLRDNWLTEARTMQAALAAIDRLETRILTSPLQERSSQKSATEDPATSPPVNARQVSPAIL